MDGLDLFFMAVFITGWCILSLILFIFGLIAVVYSIVSLTIHPMLSLLIFLLGCKAIQYGTDMKNVNLLGLRK